MVFELAEADAAADADAAALADVDGVLAAVTESAGVGGAVEVVGAGVVGGGAGFGPRPKR